MKTTLIQRGKFDNRDYKKGIDSIVRFDYMGSSEFEWGALPESLGKIRDSINDYTYLDVPIKDKVITVFCQDSQKSEVKQYLNEPTKLFRRVRDAIGDLQLSQAAQQYTPGRGVYRSAYKNALRMTATETNRSYQQADNERWKQIDWVLGIEVRRSNNPYDCDICEAGVGKYPKDYEWDLFHPWCRCVAIPITADIDDILDMMDAADRGEMYEFQGKVQDLPESFRQFQQDYPSYTHFGH
jgi:hypothetical protein